MPKRRTRNARRPRAVRTTPTLTLLRLQLDALSHHPDPDVHGQAIGLLEDVRRAEQHPTLQSFARLEAEVLHARLQAPFERRKLFLAAHSTARRLFERKLWMAGPTPALFE